MSTQRVWPPEVEQEDRRILMVLTTDAINSDEDKDIARNGLAIRKHLDAMVKRHGMDRANEIADSVIEEIKRERA